MEGKDSLKAASGTVGRWCVRTAFLLLAVLIFTGLDRLLRVKSDDGIEQARAMYYQPRNSVDVVFLGSSHVHFNINPAQMYMDYGIAGYDYSGAEQTAWETYYCLKEFLKYQKPKAAVYELFSVARFGMNDYYYRFMEQNIFGMRFSPNKLAMLKASCEEDRLKEFFPSFAVYHSRYKDLTEEDFREVFRPGSDYAEFKGYKAGFLTVVQEKPEPPTEDIGSLGKRSEEYVRKLIRLCREEGIALYFIVTPYRILEEDQMVYNRLERLAEEEGVPFRNYNWLDDEIGIVWEEDFNDDTHLNYGGSIKFTDYLARDLKEMYPELPDRRGDSRYESWVRCAETIAENAAQRLSEIKEGEYETSD